MRSSAYHGLLVFDKPAGVTSRDVVNRVQRCFPRGTRIGHAGTLDPLATGVLVLGIGKATRLTEYVQRMDKTYEARLLLGARSNTDDADGTVHESPPTGPPDQTQITGCLQEFIGEIDQVPPAFSAVKLTGRRAYDLARRGEAVSLEPRRVRIYHIELLAYDYPRLDIQVHCGKGTYIRALARDLGERLGCGALVEGLRRTRVGPFEAARALNLESDAATMRSSLLPLAEAVANLPRVKLEAADIGRLRQGQTVPCQFLIFSRSVDSEEVEVAILDQSNNLAAVAVVNDRQLLVPTKVVSELA